MQIRDLNVIPALHHHGGCRCQCITHGCDTWIKIKEYVPSQTQTEHVLTMLDVQYNVTALENH